MKNIWQPRDIIDKDIMELIGAHDMEEERKEELLKTMMETIQTRVVARVDDLFSDEEAARIKIFLETDDYDRFSEFMGERNVDIKKLYAEEALLYKLELTRLISQGV